MLPPAQRQMKVAAVLIAAGGLFTAGGAVATFRVAIRWHQEHQRRLDAHDTRLRAYMGMLTEMLEASGVEFPADLKLANPPYLSVVRQDRRSTASEG